MVPYRLVLLLLAGTCHGAEIYSTQEWREIYLRVERSSKENEETARQSVLLQMTRVLESNGCQERVANAQNAAPLLLDENLTLSRSASALFVVYSQLPDARKCLPQLRQEMLGGLKSPHPAAVENLGIALWASLADQEPLNVQEAIFAVFENSASMRVQRRFAGLLADFPWGREKIVREFAAGGWKGELRRRILRVIFEPSGRTDEYPVEFVWRVVRLTPLEDDEELLEAFAWMRAYRRGPLLKAAPPGDEAFQARLQRLRATEPRNLPLR